MSTCPYSSHLPNSIPRPSAWSLAHQGSPAQEPRLTGLMKTAPSSSEGKDDIDYAAVMVQLQPSKVEHQTTNMWGRGKKSRGEVGSSLDKIWIHEIVKGSHGRIIFNHTINFAIPWWLWYCSNSTHLGLLQSVHCLISHVKHIKILHISINTNTNSNPSMLCTEQGLGVLCSGTHQNDDHEPTTIRHQFSTAKTILSKRDDRVDYSVTETVH